MKKMKIDSQMQIILLLTVIGMVVFVVNFFIGSGSMVVNFFAVAIVSVGPIVIEYNKYREKKEIVERFPDFLRDVTQNIKTGMTLTQAIKATKRSYYGSLKPHVKRMVVKIDWGITFDSIINDFAKDQTPLIKKTTSTIIETYKGGGDITQILESASKTIKEINKIRQERSAGMYNQMITGYIVFFIFIGILIIFKNFLLKEMLGFVGTESTGMDFENLNAIYSNTFQLLIVLEGLFSGLIIGKMAEGSMIAGLKHSFILLLIGYGAYLILL